MKKISSIVAAAMLLAVLAGCNGNPASSEPSGSPSQAAEPEVSTQTDDASSSEGSAPEDSQEFSSLELEIAEGTLYIRSGDSFSVTRHDGDAVEYEINDSVLFVSDSRTGDVVLTLPEDDSYEAMRLTVKNGHVYGENALTLQSLELELDQGEATLEAVSVAKTSSIEVKRGSAFLAGDLGQSVTANCQEGRLSLEVSFARSACDYEINLSEGNIRLGETNYSGRSDSRILDNGGERSMELTCSRGDISVEFETGE